MIVFDKATFRAPARLAIQLIGLRPRIEALRDHCVQAWRHVMPWLAAMALVLAYLVAASWMDQDQLSTSLGAADQRVARLSAANSSLRTTVAELKARRPGTVFYVLEGQNVDDVKAKLARVALQLADEHYRLQQATKEPQP